jgi:FkbM family methyltransferase
MFVLDIGAHHGLYTILASKCVGSTGKVIAFEPSPRERRLLARNLRLNFCSNVSVESFALGSCHSKANLFLVQGGDDGCNSLRPPGVTAATEAVSVDVISLDEYLLKSGINQIDFVKLDVEGGEREVLRGATGLINGLSRPVFLVEVQDIRTRPWGYPAYEIVTILARARYQWFRILENGSLTPAAVHERDYDANLVAVPEERSQAVLDKIK